MPDNIEMNVQNEQEQGPGLTLLDLAIELLISVNRGSAGRLDGFQITDIVEQELDWLNEQDIIELPRMEDNDEV